MTNRGQLGEPTRALERSLRQGPADEGGYRAKAIDFGTVVPGDRRVEELGGRASVRFRRRAPVQNPLLSLARSATIVLVLIVGGFVALRGFNQLGAGQSPRPSPRASPIPVPALTQTFVSPRNGFSVRYPAGWSTQPATTSWRPGTYVPIGNSALDVLQLDGQARLAIASQRLAGGQTEATWLASFNQPYDLGSCTGDRASWPRVTVDGQLGYLDVEACPAAADVGFSSPDLRFDVIVFSGDRWYEIKLDGVVDRAYFEAILSTIRLDPARAIDPPEPS
jgi:hypothetical protein